MFSNINTTRGCICEGMIIAMEYASNAKDVAELICSSITLDIETKGEKLDL